MGDGEGLDILAAAHETDGALSVVFLIAFATIELAVESMRRGSFDFITKPSLQKSCSHPRAAR
jgi:FixJ family two-component response regulator